MTVIDSLLCKFLYAAHTLTKCLRPFEGSLLKNKIKESERERLRMHLIPKIEPYAGLHNFTQVHSAALSFPLDLFPIFLLLSFKSELYEVKFAI